MGIEYFTKLRKCACFCLIREREIGKVKRDVEEDLKKKPVNARNGNVTYVQ